MVNVIEIWEDEPRAGTFLIAKGFDRNHKKVLELVRKYENDFLDFGPLKGRKLKSTGGRAANEIMLNEYQTMFLGTLLKNSKKVVEFKKILVLNFRKLRKELEKLQAHKKEPEYISNRKTSKLVRKTTTDAMKEFVEYARSQGSKSPEMYYSNITKMMNGLLFIAEGKFKNLREMLSSIQLMTISSAEQIIDRGLRDGMSHKKFYKDIYQDVKKRVMTFADLHGKTEVIEKYLLD